MPYHIAKVSGGYKVVTTATGKEHSKAPLSREMALRQLGALMSNARPSEKK